MDLKFEKGKVTSDFKEAEELENIKSGESISTIFGKIQRWISDIGSKYFSVQEIEQRINESNKKISQNADNITKNSNQLKELKSDIDDGSIGVFRKWYDNDGIAGGLVRKDSVHSTAHGMKSIALGESSSASGMYSTTCGYGTSATSYCCSAFGFETVAAAHSQFVFGRCNEINYSDQGYVLIIGNGKSDSIRSNALTLDWDGNLWTAGDVTATDSDGNNVSLCETARIMRDSLGMIKSKNLLKNTAGTTTQNGITFTYNDDGSVTCNGTATANADYIYKITLPQNSSFILSGCPTGGSKSTYSLFARDTATWSIVYFDTGSSRTVKTGDYTTWQVVIRISNGQTVNDMTFYPMLRNADIYADDAEYEPYSDDLQTQINELRQLIMTLTTSTNTEEDINNE